MANGDFSNSLKLFFIIISIQTLGQFGQEPEPSRATGMALVSCKFLGVVCHWLLLLLLLIYNNIIVISALFNI